MSNKLEALIKADASSDDGKEMPNIPAISWTMDHVALWQNHSTILSVPFDMILAGC